MRRASMTAVLALAAWIALVAPAAATHVHLDGQQTTVSAGSRTLTLPVARYRGQTYMQAADVDSLLGSSFSGASWLADGAYQWRRPDGGAMAVPLPMLESPRGTYWLPLRSVATLLGARYTEVGGAITLRMPSGADRSWNPTWGWAGGAALALLLLARRIDEHRRLRRAARVCRLRWRNVPPDYRRWVEEQERVDAGNVAGDHTILYMTSGDGVFLPAPARGWSRFAALTATKHLDKRFLNAHPVYCVNDRADIERPLWSPIARIWPHLIARPVSRVVTYAGQIMAVGDLEFPTARTPAGSAATRNVRPITMRPRISR